MLTTKFVVLEQENQKLLVDLQHVSTGKAQQHEELSRRLHQYSQRLQQLEEALFSMHQKDSGLQGPTKEPNICFSTKFDGTRS